MMFSWAFMLICLTCCLVLTSVACHAIRDISTILLAAVDTMDYSAQAENGSAICDRVSEAILSNPRQTGD